MLGTSILGTTLLGSAPPSAPAPSTAFVSSGFCSTQFGEPTGSVGPSGASDITSVASGFCSTSFGYPDCVLGGAAAGFSSTSFGTPAHPHLQTVTATGWEVTSMGRPVAATYTQAVVNRTVSATALRPVTFGLAVVDTQVSTQASGQIATTFGSPASRRAQPAQGQAPATAFGLPGATRGAVAASFVTTKLGAPTVRVTYAATSVYKAPRWGKPRIAHGAAAPFPASSDEPSTLFGQPVCHQHYRAFHIYPHTRFGKPQLVRSPSC